MTWLLGRACTRGNALSPPSLMVVWLGSHHLFLVVSHLHTHAGAFIAKLWRHEGIPPRSPGKIEVNHGLRLRGHCARPRHTFRVGGKGQMAQCHPFPPVLFSDSSPPCLFDMMLVEALSS